MKQASFDFGNTWGGFRKGSGPKRKRKRKGVSHRTRPGLDHRTRPGLDRRNPAHVTMHLVDGLPTMRRRELLGVLYEVFLAACDAHGMRIVHWTACRNHFHLIVEAESARALARAMCGLNTRLAKALNKAWGRKGKVFDDRYFAEELTTPKRVRHALNYVLHNARRHGERNVGRVDVYGTGFWFDGWMQGRVPDADKYTRPCVPPTRWSLRTGWKQYGLIDRHPEAASAAK